MELLNNKTFVLSSQLEGDKAVYTALAEVAHRDSIKHFNLVQETVHQLSEKVLTGLTLTESELIFLVALFSSPWWGGEDHGFNESIKYVVVNGAKDLATIVASVGRNNRDVRQINAVRMLHHYLFGGGRQLAVNLQLYKSSLLVQEVVGALKKYIAELSAQKKPYVRVSTSDPGFLSSRFAVAVESRRRNADDLGYLFSDGTMMLEQQDPGLRNFADRFIIVAMSTRIGHKINTRWRVQGDFGFMPFAQSELSFCLPLSRTLGVVVSPGLAEALVSLNVAQPYGYFCDWAEVYV